MAKTPPISRRAFLQFLTIIRNFSDRIYNEKDSDHRNNLICRLELELEKFIARVRKEHGSKGLKNSLYKVVEPIVSVGLFETASEVIYFMMELGSPTAHISYCWARYYENYGESKQAIELYYQAWAESKSNNEFSREVFNYCQKILRRLEKMNEEIRFINLVLDRYPTIYYYHFYLVKAYVQYGRYEEAEKALKNMARIWPNNHKTSSYLIRVQDIIASSQSLEIIPDIVSHDNLTTIESRLKQAFKAMYDRRFEEAATLYQLVIDEEPRYEAYYGLASCCVMERDARNANIYFEKAWSLDGNNYLVRNRFARFCYNARYYPLAMKAIDKALEVDEDGMAWSLKANILRKQKKYYEAIELTEKLVKKYGKEREHVDFLTYIIAMCCFELYQLFGEETMYQRAEKLMKPLCATSASANCSIVFFLGMRVKRNILGLEDVKEEMQKYLARARNLDIQAKDLQSAERVYARFFNPEFSEFSLPDSAIA